MNKVHRIIWSKTRRAWMVVSELATGHGKGGARRRACSPATAAAVLPPIFALALAASDPAAAQVWTGNTSTNWTVGSNWAGGVAPAGGDVDISTISPNPATLGNIFTAQNGSVRNLFVGRGGQGALTIQNGTLTSNATTIPSSG